ncbi:MAG TPA: acyl carrier protein [Candidatus Paceibacterota bacterium]|nr:acyl carrier protein [Candidatus Paceibacterota bacterium]
MDTLKRIFSSVLGVDANAITPAMSPENTPSWDSLNAIVLITEIEKAFDVKFAYDEAMGVKNFGDVIALVRSKAAKFDE